MSHWSGPPVKVTLIADDTKVVTSTEVIGKSEFSGTLFREKLEALAKKKSGGGSADESKTEFADELEIWFDRNGMSLPIILSIMRGYDYSKRKFDETDMMEIIHDCKYYRVPQVIKQLFPVYYSLDRSFDPKYVDSEIFKLSCFGKRLTRTGGGKGWKVVGVGGTFTEGMQIMQFKIVKSERRDFMFGVVAVKDFLSEGNFTKDSPLKGMGYYADSGKIAPARRGLDGAADIFRAKQDDVVVVAADLTAPKTRNWKVKSSLNGEFCAEEFLDRSDVSIGEPMMFVVCCETPGFTVDIIVDAK